MLRGYRTLPGRLGHPRSPRTAQDVGHVAGEVLATVIQKAYDGSHASGTAGSPKIPPQEPTMADSTIDTVTEAARDAFYVSIGAAVLAFQKLQVQRVGLTKTIKSQLDDAQGTALEARLETVLAQIEDKLPGQARELVKQARDLVARAA